MDRPHTGRRVVDLRRGDADATALATADEHGPVGEQRRGMPVAPCAHGACRSPRVGVRVVEVGRGPACQAATDEHLAVRQQGRCVVLAADAHVAGRGPLTGRRIPDLGGREVGALGTVTAGSQDLAVRQSGEGEPGTRHGHGGGRRPAARRRVVHLGRADVRHGLVDAAGNEHPAIVKQGSGMVVACLVQAAGRRPRARGRGVQLRRRLHVVVVIHAAGGEYRAVLEQRGGVDDAARIHASCGRPGSQRRIVQQRRREVVGRVSAPGHEHLAGREGDRQPPVASLARAHVPGVAPAPRGDRSCRCRSESGHNQTGQCELRESSVPLHDSPLYPEVADRAVADRTVGYVTGAHPPRWIDPDCSSSQPGPLGMIPKHGLDSQARV